MLRSVRDVNHRYTLKLKAIASKSISKFKAYKRAIFTLVQVLLQEK